MTPSPESQPVVERRRTAWVVALVAMAALVLIAVLAVAAFAGLDLLRGPEPAADSGVVNPAIVAPAPTTIRPELHSPPSEWDDEVG
jgi:hypothetical protein